MLVHINTNVRYSAYSIGSDPQSECSFTDRSISKNVVIFGADVSSSVHINNKNKDT